MSTPLQEASRIKLLTAFTSEPNVWKADDTGETVVIGVKTTTQDADDFTFYLHTKGATTLQLLGTTTLGKDAGVAPVVYNDGTIGIYITETPAVGQPGATSELYFITLKQKLQSEVISSGPGDTWLRAQFKLFMTGLHDLAAKFI